ncbi:hypothetical protein SBD_4127 [Streptomyces bottropensis ATCC 25435]|uniref:Uncharacterized protein n=1 Tax=Streptomyces bottropensis ATCC 25435 TaxID=1054862 RepID=M3FQP2_9ACTN|nr:hypothetical protein SBD_4127 [Streptomyces bottropensis ATCC 25435]
MVNHAALFGVQRRGVPAGRWGTHQSVSATAPLPHLGVRQAPGGERGAHVVRRSWWVCERSLPTRCADAEEWWSGDGCAACRSGRPVAAG